MFYTNSTLNRADHLRSDSKSLNALQKSVDTRILPLWQNQSLISRATNTLQPAACFLTQDYPLVQNNHEGLIFLGLCGETAYFALDVSNLNEAQSAELASHSVSSDRTPAGSNATFADLRTIGPALATEEGSLLAYARGLAYWNATSRFCAECGNKLLSFNAGHAKRCSNERCEHIVFPRTDPAVIMLVTHQSEPQAEEKCLLGRGTGWPEGRFSTLAGFVEAGESLEMAVQREVLEEASIRTTDVHYVASQPWPFPRSIMLGFEATALNTEIKIDPIELAEAYWFTREQLRDFGEWSDDTPGYKLPRIDSIARHLIDRWVDGKT